MTTPDERLDEIARRPASHGDGEDAEWVSLTVEERDHLVALARLAVELHDFLTSGSLDVAALSPEEIKRKVKLLRDYRQATK